MTHADRVREYCKAHLIQPARARGDTTVSIRAGDVHAALGFKNRLPLVCSALGATVFEQFARSIGSVWKARRTARTPYSRFGSSSMAGCRTSRTGGLRCSPLGR